MEETGTIDKIIHMKQFLVVIIKSKEPCFNSAVLYLSICLNLGNHVLIICQLEFAAYGGIGVTFCQCGYCPVLHIDIQYWECKQTRIMLVSMMKPDKLRNIDTFGFFFVRNGDFKV